MTIVRPAIKNVQGDKPETLQVEWIVSNVCNYKCSYCIPALNDGSSRWPNIDNALKFFNELEEMYPGRPKHLVLTGGEPTLWPQLIKFTEQLPDSYILDITTNASRTLRFWEEFKNNSKFQKVNISAHLADCDVDHIIEVCRILQYKITTLLVLLLPGYEEKYRQIFDRLEEENLNITAWGKGIRDFDDHGATIDYTTEQNELLKRNYRNRKGIKFPPISISMLVDDQNLDMPHTQQFILNHYNRFEGWNCNIGIDRIVIDQWGNILGATCRTAHMNPIGKLGKTFTLPKKPTVCQDKVCSCLFDMRITKWRENDE